MNIVPSIEMIPAKYSAGILLCQEPMDDSGNLSVTRATTVSTRFNAAGFIETVTSGLPRLDYYTSGGTAGCPALLLEPAATNNLQRSEEFENFYWVKANGIATPTTETTAPDGNLTAETYVVNNGASGNSPIVRTIALLANTAYTLSLFVKRRDYNTATVRIYTDETSFATCSFNLSTGTASGGSILNFGNGWYRVSVTLTTAATVTNSQVQLIRDAQIRDGVAGIYIWGAQLETGSIATSYIPTTTGSVTRNADVVSKTSISGLIGQTEGTIYLDATYDAAASTATVWFAVLGTSDYIGLALGSLIRSIVNGQSDNLAGSPPDTSGIKIAWAYNASGVVCFINGTQYALTNGGSQVITQLDRVSIDMTSHANRLYDTRVRAIAIYKTRLPNYLLESATSQIESYSSLASSLSYSIV